MFPSTVASIEYIRAGRLRALAVTTAMRSGSASERSFHSPARTRRRLGGGSASARPRTRRPRSSRSSTRRSTRSWAPHGVPLAPRACPGVCQRTVQRRPPAQRCAGAELFRRPRRSRNRYRLGGFGPVGQGLVRPPLRRVTGSRKADSLDPREPRTWSPEGLAVARVRAAWVRALGFERLGSSAWVKIFIPRALRAVVARYEGPASRDPCRRKKLSEFAALAASAADSPPVETTTFPSLPKQRIRPRATSFAYRYTPCVFARSIRARALPEPSESGFHHYQIDGEHDHRHAS
jgi:hypothetical protein